SAEGAQRVAEAIEDSALIPGQGTHDAAVRAPFADTANARPTDLLAALGAAAPETRAAAARALWDAPALADQAVPGLIRALGDSDPRVRAAAAWTLGRFQGEAEPARAA